MQDANLTALVQAIAADIKALQAAGGGSAMIYVANVTVSPAQYGQADVTVANADITAGSSIVCNLMPNADWDADDLAEFEVFATPAAGSASFTMTRPGPIVGGFKITYMIG